MGVFREVAAQVGGQVGRVVGQGVVSHGQETVSDAGFGVLRVLSDVGHGAAVWRRLRQWSRRVARRASWKRR